MAVNTYDTGEEITVTGISEIRWWSGLEFRVNGGVANRTVQRFDQVKADQRPKARINVLLGN